MRFTDDRTELQQVNKRLITSSFHRRSQQQLRPASKIFPHAPQTSKFDYVGSQLSPKTPFVYPRDIDRFSRRH